MELFLAGLAAWDFKLMRLIDNHSYLASQQYWRVGGEDEFLEHRQGRMEVGGQS